MNNHNVIRKLDIIYTILLLTALLSFFVTGKNLAEAIQAYCSCQYPLMIIDLLFAIWLFAAGFLNYKKAWGYFKIRLGLWR